MHPAVVSQRYTPEELLAMPDGHRFDLVDGHLMERNMGADRAVVYSGLSDTLAAPGHSGQER